MGSGVKNDQFSKSREILVFFGLGGLPKNGLPLFSAVVWRFWFGPKVVRIYVFSERVVDQGEQASCEVKSGNFSKSSESLVLFGLGGFGWAWPVGGLFPFRSMPKA